MEDVTGWVVEILPTQSVINRVAVLSALEGWLKNAEFQDLAWEHSG